MKYIIDLEPIKDTNLFKAKGFNTLVFDAHGINMLEPYEENFELKDGSLVKTPNGTVVYEFKSYSNDGHLNVINTSNGKFTTLSANKYVVLS